MRFHQIIASSIMSQVGPDWPKGINPVHKKGPCRDPQTGTSGSLKLVAGAGFEPATFGL